MTTASIELLAGAVTLLLFAAGQNMDVHRSRWKVLDHYSLVRSIMFVGSVNAASIPVGPIDELAEHCHSKWVDGCVHNDLTVRANKRRSFNLL